MSHYKMIEYSFWTPSVTYQMTGDCSSADGRLILSSSIGKSLASQTFSVHKPPLTNADKEVVFKHLCHSHATKFIIKFYIEHQIFLNLLKQLLVSFTISFSLLNVLHWLFRFSFCLNTIYIIETTLQFFSIINHKIKSYQYYWRSSYIHRVKKRRLKFYDMHYDHFQTKI